MGLSWDALIFNMDFESIVVLVHSWIQLGGIGFAPSNEDLAFRAGICHLLNLFLRTMFKLRQGRSPIFGTFFLWCCSENLFEKAQILEPFWFLFLGRELGQVSTFWWWLDYLAAQVGPGKRILWLNADETSLSRVGAKKAVGHIVSKRWWPTRLGPKRPCQKDQRRASVTHIACMCSETSVQPHLPQVFLGAKRSMPAAATLVEHPQIQIWRRDTAWNTTSTMLQWLDLLASRLLPFTEFQPILLLDMAPCHLSPVIAEKASSLGFFLAYVPARLTSLVQPADVAMFAGYKVNLVKLLLQNESLAGEVSLEAWIECLGKVCRQYLCGKKWKKAFERTGIIPGGILTPELAQIAAPRLCVSPLPCPDFDSVASLFPKGRRVPYTSLFWVPAQMDPPLLEWVSTKNEKK